PAPSAWPLLLSAKTDQALGAQAERLRQHLLDQPELELLDVAFSLATTRSHFERRAALLCADRLALLDSLAALAQGQPSPDVVLDDSAAGGKLALLCSGQGSQRLAMGRPLYLAFPVFRDALDAICSRFDPDLDRPLLDVLF